VLIEPGLAVQSCRRREEGSPDLLE